VENESGHECIIPLTTLITSTRLPSDEWGKKYDNYDMSVWRERKKKQQQYWLSITLNRSGQH